MAFSFAETLILPPLASEAPQFVDSFLGNLQRLAWRARPSAANCPVAFEQRPGRSVTANVRRVDREVCDDGGGGRDRSERRRTRAHH